MNKAEISNMLEAWNFTSEAKKSVANRLESALTKTGSASSRLNMASASIAKLAETLDEETTEQAEAQTMSAFLKFCSLVAVDNKKPATQKTKREQWHDADSAEAQEILSAKKPRKNKVINAETIKTEAHEQINVLLDVLNELAKMNSK